MIQIIPGDRAGADNLAEIVDPVCNTVMAAGPDAQVDSNPIAPEDRMRVYVRRACIAHNIAGIVHSGRRGGEKSGRDRQLLDGGRVVGVRDVIFPNDRKDVALTRYEAGIINRARLTYHLTAQRAQIGHLTAAQNKPMNKRANRAVADDMAQIVDPIGFAVVQGDTLAQKAEINGLRVLV